MKMKRKFQWIHASPEEILLKFFTENETKPSDKDKMCIKST